MDSLSAELILNIVSFLDATDLPALARCAKQYANITRPYIFESIKWHCEPVKSSFTTEYRGMPPKRLGRLLRSLLENPGLWTFVKRLELGTPFPASDDRRPTFALCNDSITPNPEHMDSDILALLDSTSPVPTASISPSLIQPLRSGSVDACCALLLAHSSNIESLELGECIVHRSSYISNTIHSKRHQYTKLRHLTLCRHIAYYWSDRIEVDFNLVLPLLALPSMEEASVVVPEPGYWVSSVFSPLIQQQSLSLFTTSLPQRSTLTILRLRHSSIRPDNLRSIIDICMCLRVLEYGLAVNGAAGHDGEPASCIVHAEQITWALQSAASRLQELRLSIDWMDTNPPGYNLSMRDTDKVEGRLGCMKHFVVLRTLEAPVIFLLGYEPTKAPNLHDILPLSVTSLMLRDDLSHFCDFDWAWRPGDQDLPLIDRLEIVRSAKPIFTAMKILSAAKHAGVSCVTELTLLLTTLFRISEWGPHNLQMNFLGGLMSRAGIRYTVVVYVPAFGSERHHHRRYSFEHARDATMHKERYVRSFDVDPDHRAIYSGG